MSRNDGRSKQFIIPALLTAIHSLQQWQLLDNLGSFNFNDLKEAVERALEDWLDRPVPVGSSAQINSSNTSMSNNTNITNSRISLSLTMIGPDDIETHAGLLYEAFVRPKASGAGPSLALREESLEMSEEQLLGKLEESLLARLENEEERKGEQREEYREMLERFRADGRSYLSYLGRKRNNKKQNKESSAVEWEQREINSPVVENIPRSRTSTTDKEEFLQSPQSTTRKINIESSGAQNILDIGFNIEASADPYQYPPKSNMTRSDTPRSMIAFLAHIRKAGMDMIFPQDLHDKTLLATFMALKCGAPLAHREVMDMVNAAIQSRLFQHDLDSVSKTKVRGVLTLLKNSHSIKTGTGEGGEGIRLFLGDGVSEFADFRDKHDQFVKHLLSQQRIVMNKEVKAEVVWLEDKAGKGMKAEKYADLQQMLEDYFLRGILPMDRALPSNSSANDVAKPLRRTDVFDVGNSQNEMFTSHSFTSKSSLSGEQSFQYTRSLLSDSPYHSAAEIGISKSHEPFSDHCNDSNSRSKSWLPGNRSLDGHHYNYTTPPQSHPSSSSIPLYHSSQSYVGNKIPDSSQALFAKALTHIRPRKEKIVNPTSFQPPLPQPFGSAASPQYRYPPPPPPSAVPGISRDFYPQQSFPPKESRDFYRYSEKRDALGSLRDEMTDEYGRSYHSTDHYQMSNRVAALQNPSYYYPDDPSRLTNPCYPSSNHHRIDRDRDILESNYFLPSSSSNQRCNDISSHYYE